MAATSPLSQRLHEDIAQSVRALREHLLSVGVRDDDVLQGLQVSGLSAFVQPQENGARAGAGEHKQRSRSRSRDRVAMESNRGRQRAHPDANEAASVPSGPAPSEPPPAVEKFDVRLPDDVVPGQTLTVRSPSGRKYHIVVPANASPDTLITVNVRTDGAHHHSNSNSNGNSKHPRSRGGSASNSLGRGQRDDRNGSRSKLDAPPAHQQQQQHHQQAQQPKTLSQIMQAELFNNPEVLDVSSGKPLRPQDWKWWFDTRKHRVQDIFDMQGRVHSQIHTSLSGNPQLTKELEAICAAVPMAWRDALHNSHQQAVEASKAKAPRKGAVSGTNAALEMGEDGKLYAANPVVGKGRGAT